MKLKISFLLATLVLGLLGARAEAGQTCTARVSPVLMSPRSSLALGRVLIDCDFPVVNGSFSLSLNVRLAAGAPVVRVESDGSVLGKGVVSGSSVVFPVVNDLLEPTSHLAVDNLVVDATTLLENQAVTVAVSGSTADGGMQMAPATLVAAHPPLGCKPFAVPLAVPGAPSAPVADVIVRCTGGIPGTAQGLDATVALNVPQDGRAALLVAGETAPLVGVAGTGPTDGDAVMFPSVGTSRAEFRGVRVVAPGYGQTMLFRVTGLSARLDGPTPPYGSGVQASLQLLSPDPLLRSDGTVTVAYVIPPPRVGPPGPPGPPGPAGPGLSVVSIQQSLVIDAGTPSTIYLVTALTGNVTVTLPPAAAAKGRLYWVVLLPGTPLRAIVNTQGESLDGSSSVTLYSGGSSRLVTSDGNSWWTVTQ